MYLSAHYHAYLSYRSSEEAACPPLTWVQPCVAIRVTLSVNIPRQMVTFLTWFQGQHVDINKVDHQSKSLSCLYLFFSPPAWQKFHCSQFSPISESGASDGFKVYVTDRETFSCCTKYTQLSMPAHQMKSDYGRWHSAAVMMMMMMSQQLHTLSEVTVTVEYVEYVTKKTRASS